MQVARSLRRLTTGPIAVAIFVTAQLVQPAGVVAQERDFEKEAEKIINEVRSRLPSCELLQSDQPVAVRVGAAQNRPILTWNPRLASIAQGHSTSMAKESFFDHTDMHGKTVADRAKQVGYKYRVVAENIAAGQDSLSEVFMEWTASKGHCENMLDGRVTEFGLARVKSPSLADPYGVYWTLVLGTPQGK
jgi:uncharacterized protein YkwD